MINTLLLLIVPFIIAVLALIFFRGKVTIGEFCLQIIAPLIVAALLVTAFTYKEMTATELWNSQITRRDRTEVSCSHSYRCHCHMVSSGSGKNRTYSEECDTCYEHSYDVDWSVTTSTNESIDIDRVDRQGLIMPPRWEQAYIGEPFTSAHPYTNYLLLNKGSVLFGGRGDVQKFAPLIPAYPQVFDYYRANHALITGGLPIDPTPWNWLVNEANKTLGPKKQVNTLVVIAKTDDPAYALALKTAWNGGQKNDLIVVIGSLDGHKIEFVDIVSWSPRQDLHVELRDQIQDIGTLDKRDDIVKAITDQTTAKFERLHMKKYKYLLASADLSTTQMLSAFIICVLLEIGITVWVVRNDINLPGFRNSSSDNYRY